MFYIVITFFALTQSTFNFAILNGLSKSRREVGNCEESACLALFASAEYLFSPAPIRADNRLRHINRINCTLRSIIFVKRKKKPIARALGEASRAPAKRTNRDAIPHCGSSIVHTVPADETARLSMLTLRYAEGCTHETKLYP